MSAIDHADLAVVAEQHRAQRIADQQQRDAGLVEQRAVG
jgi:hypothetical protein